MSPSGGGDDRSMCVAMTGMLSLRNREDDNTSCMIQHKHVTIITNHFTLEPWGDDGCVRY